MNYKYHYLLLAVAACIIAFSFQGTRGLFESTEGRYAECAREMMEAGNYIFPQLNYHPHWTKPPMTYWAIAAGMKLLGQNDWGVRLYAAVSFILLTGAITALGTILWNRRCGLLAGLIYVSAPYSVSAAFSVTTDILLSLWITLAVMAYWKAYTAQHSFQRRWINLFWLFLGLGFLTKGPAVLMILGVILVFQIYLRKTERQYPSLITGLGIGAFVVFGLGWHIWVITHNPRLLSYMFEDEVVGRLAANDFGRNPQWYYPFMAYLPLMLSPLIPWALLWPSGYVAGFGKILRSGQWRDWLKNHDRAVFLLLWAGIPLTIFSIAICRMPLYVLPHFAAVVLCVARSIDRLSTGWDTVILRKAATLAIIMLAVMLGVKAYLTYSPNKKNMMQLYKDCRAKETPNTGIYVFDCDSMYGLQFYLHGKLGRVGSSYANAEPDCTLDDLIGQIKQNPQHETYLVVARPSKKDVVSDALKQSAVSFTVTPARNNYELFVISPPGNSTAR